MGSSFFHSEAFSGGSLINGHVFIDVLSFFGFCSLIWNEFQWMTLESTRKIDNVSFSTFYSRTHTQTWILWRMRECAWNTHLICNNTYRERERERETHTLHLYTRRVLHIAVFSHIWWWFFFFSFQLLPTIFILNLFYSFQTTNNKHTHTHIWKVRKCALRTKVQEYCVSK